MSKKKWNPIGSLKKNLRGQVNCSNCNEKVRIVDKKTGLCKSCFKAQFHWQE